MRANSKGPSLVHVPSGSGVLQLSKTNEPKMHVPLGTSLPFLYLRDAQAKVVEGHGSLGFQVGAHLTCLRGLGPF